MLTKTMWNDYFTCPLKYKKIHIDNAPPRRDAWREAARMRFIRFNDYIWTAYENSSIDEIHDSVEASTLPMYDKALMTWLLEIEQTRYDALVEYGRKDEWLPVSTSGFIENNDFGISGEIDRVDYWNKSRDEKCIVSFVFDENYISKHVIRRCMFDSLIYNDEHVTHGRIINPITQKIKTYEITTDDIASCWKTIEDMCVNFKDTCTMQKHSDCLLCRVTDLNICEEVMG